VQSSSKEGAFVMNETIVLRKPWFSNRFGYFFRETSYVAKVYGDSLRDNFVGYKPTDPQKFEALRTEFDEAMAEPQPYLAVLLRIEAALLEAMPDEVVLARFWSVLDRFQRVVPQGTRTTYETSVPARGDAVWQNATFVRNQTRSLIDVIHANYLVNIGREQSIKRLKIIIFLTLIGATALTGLLITWIESPLFDGLAVLWVAGVTGAIMSITNRLQSAVSRDAMTEDGIYELTGLRVGWVGIMTSIVAGGAFALVMYFVVMAELLDVAYPHVDDRPALTQTAQPTSTAQSIETAEQSDARPADPEAPPPEPSAAQSEKPVSPPLPNTPALRESCTSASDPTCLSPGNRLAKALGLLDRMSFFKMLILAFLAGFAERLVPDILSRLSKRQGAS
jgi:hypothetical protein